MNAFTVFSEMNGKDKTRLYESLETICPTPRPPDKCGRLPALSGKGPQEADSAFGGFVRHFPHLPVTPAVGRQSSNSKKIFHKYDKVKRNY